MFQLYLEYSLKNASFVPMGKNCSHNRILCYGLDLNIIFCCVTIHPSHKRACARASRARARVVRERARACESVRRTNQGLTPILSQLFNCIGNFVAPEGWSEAYRCAKLPIIMYYRYAHVAKRGKQLGDVLCVDVFTKPVGYPLELGEVVFPILTLNVDLDKKYPSIHLYSLTYEGYSIAMDEFHRVRSFLMEKNFRGRVGDYDLITSGQL